VHVLIIDDNEEFRSSTQDLLLAAGYSVTVVGDGEAGVLAFQQGNYDLVICDLFMPRKDGLETVAELRQYCAKTPIISTTGYVDTLFGADKEINLSYLKAACEFGATHTLTKPFDPDFFLALVRNCLGIAAG